VKKLGANAYPFTFRFPPNAPSSVTLQSGEEDTEKPLGVMYTVKTYVAENPEEESHRRSSVALTIKKVRPRVRDIVPVLVPLICDLQCSYLWPDSSHHAYLVTFRSTCHPHFVPNLLLHYHYTRVIQPGQFITTKQQHGFPGIRLAAEEKDITNEYLTTSVLCFLVLIFRLYPPLYLSFNNFF
jgi:hypothetical protein